MMSYSDPSPQNFLLMIENSSALAAFWPDLRDCYLPRLVEQLSGTVPAHLTNIFLSESRPIFYDFQTSVTKQCSSLEAGLSECQFNYEPDNRLSVAQIQGGIKFLSSGPTNQMRHLIIVAATAPKGFGIGHLPFDPWNELAKMLTKEEVYLHLALTSNLRSGRLPNLFQQTLKWQRHNEEPLWLPKYSTALIFRVSAPQSYPDSVQVISETKLACPASRAQGDLASDIYTKAPLDDIPAESPSLVSQLQQVHGLTKKKVYGTKPARIPFIMERVRDPYRKAPSQSPSISLAPETGAPPSLTRGSRSRSNLKPDRAFSSRLQRIIEPYPAVQQWQQQPMSPTEGDSPGHSPYSSSTRSLPSSPIAQMPAAEGYPYALSAPMNIHSTLPADLDLAWAAKADDVSFPYDSLLGYGGGNSSSYFPSSQSSFHQDAKAFQGIHAPREITSTSPAFSTIPPLDSPSYPIAHRSPTTAYFGGGFHQYHDEQAGFAAPPSPTTTHIHAPAPCLALPAAQMDDLLFASAAGASPMQMHILPLPPPSILPPIAPHAFQDLTRFRNLEHAATERDVSTSKPSF
ncbi:hypothetical protein DFH08DRAFT_945832 [Mycena albidolilacea]|uniref:Uncharacterized protein n=1 Tax=Mycena albidolilacea TaxID=1033008 RepID=A0AAD6YYX8_9AGAR|nr:hypothetical protein DFH08DRAFT_945832 [Mycena albidolilacea]